MGHGGRYLCPKWLYSAIPLYLQEDGVSRRFYETIYNRFVLKHNETEVTVHLWQFQLLSPLF